MRKSLLKLLGVVAGLMLSTCVSALGLGGINVTSALGQPLKADIELVAVGKAEKASLVARLASPDVYKGAGLEYPYGNKFQFKIESRANGESYLKVSSAQPVNDPFVSLLVELSWASGKLLREYTFLLDPPDYVPEQPKPAEVEAVAPAVQAEALPAEAAPAPVTAEQSAPEAAAPVETKPVEQPAARPAPAAPAKQAAAAPAKPVATGNVTVKRGDTLNKIAVQNKPSDVSLERMLVALYRANAEQFDGKNMNRIKTGKILRLPEQTELASVEQAAAVKEIRAQAADWNAYRQRLASAAAVSAQPQEAQQVATGKITSSVSDKAPVTKESAKEVLKLSKGEAPGDKVAAGTGGKASEQDKKNAAQEEAIAKAKALKEEQGRAAALEQNLKDMQRLAQLKSEAAALAQSASAVAPESAVAAASEVKPAPVAKPKPKPQPKVVQPEPTLVDQILGEPLYLAAGAAVLLGLGGLGVMMRRRKQAETIAVTSIKEDVGSITGRMMTPVAPSPETGDFTAPPEAHADEGTFSEDVDPISEADLFLNFGRDAQAEEILKEALQKTPNDHRIHLKLLGIYANRKDVNSFAGIARQLRDSGDDEAWQQAAAMGRKLEPNNPMYGGTIEEVESATMHAPAFSATPEFAAAEAPAESVPEVDFDLGEASPKAAPVSEPDFMEAATRTTVLSPEEKAAAQSEPMDFDVTSTNPSMAAASEAMDFDVTSTSPALAAAIPVDVDITGSLDVGAMAAEKKEKEEGISLSELDDLIFDVTATHPSMPAAQPEAEKPAADEGAMAFTLDFPIEAGTQPAAAAQPADIGLADISLNLEGMSAAGEPVVAEVRDEHWHEVATKLDLARAYQEMGDATGAREILEEVLKEGDVGQREAAQAIIDQLG